MKKEENKKEENKKDNKENKLKKSSQQKKHTEKRKNQLKSNAKVSATESESNPKRMIRCVVSKDKMNKSRVGESVRLVRHPLLGKYIKRTTKIMFHDEENLTAVGDHVIIYPSRPISAHKSYKLHSIEKKIEQK